MSEKPPPLPQDHELPLDIKASSGVVKSGESHVWQAAVQDSKEQNRLIALKQIQRVEFANDSEMRQSKEFYDYLKQFPDFGAFVPDTLYFKARINAQDQPRAFALQQYLKGKTIDQIPDEELYKDTEVVTQLLTFAKASVRILQTTRDEKTYKPDFGTAHTADAYAQKQGNRFGNSRFSTNIFITDKDPQHEHAQRVFFVDTGVNADERVSQLRQVVERHFMGRLREFNFNRWVQQLESMHNSTQ